MWNRFDGSFSLAVPDLSGFGFDALEEKSAEVQRLADQLRDAGRSLRELQGQRTAAEREDTRSHAESIKAGMEDLRPRAVQKLEAQIAAVSRRRDALRVVLEDRGRELLALVDSHRDEWTAEAEDSLTGAEERAEEARTALERSEAEVLRHKQVLAFIEDPSNYKPGRVAKKPYKAPEAPTSTFSVIGGRPSGAA